ncbi:MAG: glycosyltransferase family 4 protein [Ignavibacteriaceae bacterium]|nr:glycosyltransferase family 4 protein [Ignavibacteriaceae bacterium]
MSSKNKVIITFLGNLNYDTRCKNLFNTLKVNGYEIQFLGFDWLTKDFEPVGGDVTIHKLHRGFLSLSFYLKFTWHIKFFLMASKASIIFAEDIYTLPFAVLFGKLKRSKVFYDSRELYGHLAGLKGKKAKQGFWRIIEKFFIKKVDHIITTGKLDSDFLKEKYKVDNTILLRNLPRYYKPEKENNLRLLFGIEKHKKILLYQGVIHQGRGLHPIYEALKELQNCVLIIIGDGEFEDFYKNLAMEMGINEQVIFAGKVNQDEILSYTKTADVGLSIIENMSLSYYYALPNKLFEYIMAEIPVVVSNLPQMKEIVEKHEVGKVVDLDNPDELVEAIKQLIADENLYNMFKENCRTASQELNWENEAKNLLDKL